MNQVSVFKVRVRLVEDQPVYIIGYRSIAVQYDIHTICKLIENKSRLINKEPLISLLKLKNYDRTPSVRVISRLSSPRSTVRVTSWPGPLLMTR